jgi:hypothetical protein
MSTIRNNLYTPPNPGFSVPHSQNYNPIAWNRRKCRCKVLELTGKVLMYKKNVHEANNNAE